MAIGDDYEIFIKKVHTKSGLDLSNYKRPQMERRIRTLMRSQGASDLVSYFSIIDRDSNQYQKFIDHLTINVSEFLRNPSQWDVLRNKILPQLLKENPKLKVWSAGCSTGEEPYSLAITMLEARCDMTHKIIASDIDREVLRKAQIGLYGSKSLANIPDALVKKYFIEQGSGFYQVKDELKKHIKFQQHNLLKDSFESNVDLILCRNVVIYFTEETKSLLYKRFYQSLRKGGILFTGSTEQIFQAREIGFSTAATFFYQKL
ncbi:protein-glutamate O-methyltransferase CheR [Heliorestis acidaminivorans]|uniref:protein-glutamate O-methyltransferase n=1 Tax=Heliorestis acidaminivorans TaxID=553427 RepID=A0A6I0EY66_9FIRM|nr:protein-glutamate O-methyltransferase CheR [Heliorestis acidaminivorans]KAB2952270.1 protein-glutamate O-methyltransferase CheR [Heliorestis acidaminivorans]